MEPPRHAIAATMARVARDLNGPRTVEDTLEAIVKAACVSVPGFSHAGVTLVHHDSRVETLTASDDLVRKLDQVQYEHADGPCLDALRACDMVSVEDLRHEQRWPAFVHQALEGGVRALLAFRLYEDGETLGALNLYRTDGSGIDKEAPHVAELLATHASLALGRARTEQQLHHALSTRKIIGQAIGITMERYQINETRAFEFLVRVSSTGNVKLRDVAEELTSRTSAAYTSEGAEERPPRASKQ